MTKIYRTSDIIPLKVDGLRIGISPLTFEQKMQVQEELLKGDAQGAMRGASLAVRSSVKELSGLKTSDGQDYQLDFDEEGRITSACWDDLCNIQENDKLIMICLGLVNGVPKDFIDPNTGKKIEGVSIISQESSSRKKK